MEAASSSCFSRNEFLIRRLHSLSGLIPVGAYMVVHLCTNFTVFFSPAFFQKQVDNIHSLDLFLPFVELTFIFIPILFHAILGVVIIRTGVPNTSNYKYGNNVRYTLQRVTGMIAFAFIMLHVFHMHHYGKSFGAGWGNFDPHNAAASAAIAMTGIWVPIVYAIGVLSCVFHLANGLWTMGITWGVWISPAAQQRANYVCGGLGVVLAIAGLGSIIGLKKLPNEKPTAVQHVEQQASRTTSIDR